jgi:hypothetical protein
MWLSFVLWTCVLLVEIICLVHSSSGLFRDSLCVGLVFPICVSHSLICCKLHVLNDTMFISADLISSPGFTVTFVLLFVCSVTFLG